MREPAARHHGIGLPVGAGPLPATAEHDGPAGPAGTGHAQRRMTPTVLIVAQDPRAALRIASVAGGMGLCAVAAPAAHDIAAVANRIAPDVLIVGDAPAGASLSQLRHVLRSAGFDRPVLTLHDAYPPHLGTGSSDPAADADEALRHRIRAALRAAAAMSGQVRGHAPSPAAQSVETIRHGGLLVKPRARRVFWNGRAATLTPRELELLLALVRRGGDAATHVELCAEICRDARSASSRAIAMHVMSIRRKLGDDPTSPRLIVNVRNVGYRLVAEEDAAEDVRRTA